MKLITIILAIVYFSIAGASLIKAQSAPNTDMPLLSGSEHSAESILNKSDAIFVGKVISKGWVNTMEPGSAGYSPKISVTLILKGKVESEIQVYLHVKNTRAVIEAPPQVGQSYIFFTKDYPNQLRVLKLLPATDENIVKIKALLSQAPK